MKVIGIDPSLSSTGLCWAIGESETIKLKADDPRRLVRLHDIVYSRAIAQRLAVIEDLPTHAMSAGLTGQAQGLVRKVLQEQEIPYLTVPPATLKKFATGSGKATKGEMLKAYEARMGTAPGGMDDNQIDAWWLREMGVHYLRHFDTVRRSHFDPSGTCKWSDIPWTEGVPAL